MLEDTNSLDGAQIEEQEQKAKRTSLSQQIATRLP